MASIGIDFGLNDCKIAVLRNSPEIIEVEGNHSMPAVIAWDDGEMLVGKAAKNLAMVLPSVKRMTF